MSTYSCPVVVIGKTAKNPNADTLRIWGSSNGPIQFKEGEFAEGERAIYVPVDSMVPVDRPEFAFLKDGANADGKFRLRGIKLRGIPSCGLLIKCNQELPVGYDASVELGCTKYEPPQTHSFGAQAEAESPPSDVLGLGVYDIENTWQFAGFEFEAGGIDKLARIDWSLTEKIHGCNGRLTVDSKTKEFKIGSRTRWVKDDGKNPWSLAKVKILSDSRIHPIAAFLERHVLFFEVYGPVQDLHYGVKDGVGYAVFDIYSKVTGQFLPAESVKFFSEAFCLNRCPDYGPVHYGTLESAIVEAQARLDRERDRSYLAMGANIAEGIVVRPRWVDVMVKTNNTKMPLGRLITKVIGSAYRSRHGGTENQ